MKRLLAGLALICLTSSGVIAGKVEPVQPGFVPQDSDERGLWMQMDDLERELKASNFVIRDSALNAYVRQVFCRTVGDAACKDVRIYLVRTPYFNASMAPNGMMLVYSGLFLRARNEAQLAAVLGHEYTHFAGRHSVRNFRDAKKKTNALAWLSVVPIASYGAAAAMTVAQYGLLGSIFAFSRDMERDADAGSITLLAKAGYDPQSASHIWEQLRAEMDATAAARGKKSRKDRGGGMFASHPSTLERMTVLKAHALQAPVSEKPVVNRDAYLAALAPHWSGYVDDQIKLNDFGATDMLLTALATEGWTPALHTARGENFRARGRVDDLAAAVAAFDAALKGDPVRAEAHRGRGLALLRLGKKEEGQAALKTYLRLRPDAADRDMMAMLAGELRP